MITLKSKSQKIIMKIRPVTVNLPKIASLRLPIGRNKKKLLMTERILRGPNSWQWFFIARFSKPSVNIVLKRKY